MRTLQRPSLRLSLVCALSLAMLSTLAPVQAATPKDTLVVVTAMDDIVTLDPAESFEISAGEIMGNAYDRLVRYDVADPAKLLPDVAKSWTVSADGKTITFEIKDGLKFASGNPLTAEDVAFSLQRAVILGKTPAFILTQFGLNKANVAEKVRAAGKTVVFEIDKSYAPTLVLNCLTANVASIVDKKTAHVQRAKRRHGLCLAENQLRGFRPHENPRMACQRNRHVGKK